MSQVCDVSVIGLGAIGWGAAASLIREGYEVYGVDIRSEVLEQFAEEKGKPCASAAEAVKKAPVVMIFLVNDVQIEEVLFGSGGAVASADEGTVFILCTTMPPGSAIRIGQQLESAGMLVIDAPVIGGAPRALRGELKVMASGSAEAFEIADPVFDAISGNVIRIGDAVGQASQIKMINQLLAGVHIAAAAEAITLAAKIGVDLTIMHDIVSHSTGSSWMFEDRGSHIINGDYAPRSAIDIILKDLGIVQLEAEAAKSSIPLANATLALFSEAAAGGHGKEDGSAVAKLLAEKSGVLLPGMNGEGKF